MGILDSSSAFELPYMQFTRLSFRCYQPQEIKKLSVLEINQTKTFDEIGFPIKNGLYDPALGPSSDQFAHCETCGLKGIQCPGHFGHIQLSVPVFNPLFFTFTYNLMKGSCIHCHRFTNNTKEKSSVVLLEKLRKISEDQTTKNNMALRNELLKDYLRQYIFKRRIKCPHCKKSNGILRNDANRAFLLDFSGRSNLKEATKSPKTPLANKKKPLSSQTKNLEEDEEELEEKKDLKLNMQVSANTLLDPLILSEQHLAQQLRQVLSGACEKLVWRAAETKQHFRLLWQSEAHVLKQLFPFFVEVEGGYPIDILFCESVLVEPPKFRPVRHMAGEMFEHGFTTNLRKLLEADQLLTVIKVSMSSALNINIAAKELIEQKVYGKTMNEKLHNAYLSLQVRANCLYDSESDKMQSKEEIRLPALKQLLEKKEGLFRMHMMGKRVNYACRSVITPDPYLDIDEIGIPELFARRLTFPEPVNYLNTSKLRELVSHGPAQHPGANYIQSESNFKKMLSSRAKDADRIAVGMRLAPGTTNQINAQPTYVFRHLDKGDCLLMNRQPSLHKPSIMGHRARILKGQNALRMNYAPCKAYNADFDGDEMNGHFPQNYVAQTEVRELSNVGNNYLVPKDGTPILGLIQDHVVSGVLMCVRDRFFNREDFMNLVFSAFAETTKRIKIPPPTIFRPRILWSGKQILSTIILNLIPEDMPKINLCGKAKTPLSCWKVEENSSLQFEMSESQVIFRSGELLVGVLDKAHYGATQYGLIHCCYELYGPKVAVQILSCFSRVFTTFLQARGFTLGVADILVDRKADRIRRKAIREVRKCGDDVVRRTFSLPDDATPLKLKHVMATAYNNPRHDSTDVKQLDYTMKQTVAKFCETINNSCVPRGLIRTFPENALQLMIQSGAKGSMVNSIQISCALGQIELEGQRPPLSAVGRTLPSFRCFDPSPRAGGFVDQRFLTGINPQELFFHTMAGREGLVDTAVKTSRSGYLQRCIVKHLEGLTVRYDHTVRDHDNSVVQFRYGEDGMDVGKATFLNAKQFPFLEDNIEAATLGSVPKSILETKPKAGKTHLEEPTDHFGELPHKIVSEIKSYTKKRKSTKEFKRTIFWKSIRALVDPGENVGLLAAQSIGEPSTQMTLNTFHFAGRGEMNVTLGIPRLREILMTNGKNIATPMTEINILDGVTDEEIEKIKSDLNPVFLKQVCRRFILEESITLSKTEGWREYTVTLQLLRNKDREKCAQHLSRKKILNELENKFFKSLANGIFKRFKDVLKYQQIQHRRLRASNMAAGIEDVDNEKSNAKNDVKSSDEEADGEADASEMRLNRRHQDDGAEYEGEEDDKNDLASKDPTATMGNEFEEILDDSEGEEGAIPDDSQLYKEEREEEDDDTIDQRGSAISNIVKNGGIKDKDEMERKARSDRIGNVINKHAIIVDYKYDVLSDRWCCIKFQLPLENKSKLDIKSIVEKEVEKFIVKQVPGIEKCIVREEQKPDGRTFKVLQTQGINLEALYRRWKFLDMRSLYSNDINLMLNNYGIEACGRTILKEMNNVFGVYGIEVNSRHLSLTADYMTFTGKVQPFSRGAMSNSVSPIQKMTFETTVAFMRESIINGNDDDLSSPSARIVTGQLLNSGTGAFKLMAKPNYVIENN